MSMYLLYGDETFLLESFVKKIVKDFGEKLDGINYIKLNESDVDTIIDNIETPSFGYSKKLIIVKNSNIFKNPERLNSYINENVELIKESVVIIFIEEKIEKCDLVETIEKYGKICEFNEQKPAQIVQRLKAVCNGYKVNISGADLNYFVSVCGTNMQDLINEIRKLIEYTGEGGTIKKEDIDTLAIRQIDAVIFDLTDALGSKNTKGAMRVFNDLIYIKEPIQRILITLYNHFKKLYLIKLSIRYNKDIASSLNLKDSQMFLINKYKKQAGCFEEETLRALLRELTELDANYKVRINRCKHRP